MGSGKPCRGLNSFDPDMTRAMASALDSAWQQLRTAGHVTSMPYRAAVTRETMASAILRQARNGVTDPQLLVGAAMTAILTPQLLHKAVSSPAAHGYEAATPAG
jgi:hypothetical protein